MNSDDRTTTRWAHRGLGGPWWLALLLIPLLMAGAFVWLRGGDVEDDLVARASAHLEDEGVTGVEVTADGRDLTVNQIGKGLPRGVTAEQVEKMLEDDVDGVRSASVQEVISDTTGESGKGTGAGKGGPGTGAGGKADCGSLQAQVDAILGRNQVAFAESSSKVEGAELQQVVQVAELLAACKKGAEVTGHVDARANAGTKVDDQRAANVAKVLRDHGVTVTLTTGVGASDPLGDDATKAGRDLNRYAAISVQ